MIFRVESKQTGNPSCVYLRGKWPVLGAHQGFPGGSAVQTLPASARHRRHTGRTRGGCLTRNDPLEEETAVPSGILAWKRPWTEEPGGLQSSSGSRGGGGTQRTQALPGALSMAGCAWPGGSGSPGPNHSIIHISPEVSYK